MRASLLATILLPCAVHMRRIQMQDSQDHGVKGSVVRDWELENAARHIAGETNLAGFGLANFKAAAKDPSIMLEVAHMLKDPTTLAELQKMTADPSFSEQAKRAMIQSASSGSKSDVPAILAEVKEMMSDPHFQEDMKRIVSQMNANDKTADASLMERWGSQKRADIENENKHGESQSLAQVSDSALQAGAKGERNILKALALLLLAFDPTAAFVPAAKSRFQPHVAANSRQRSTAVTQMTTGVADVDNVGITEPLGFFDPAGLSTDKSEAKIRFLREVELKHGRVSMLAALGFLVGEQFHPLFGGDIDDPSFRAFQQTPLQTFWPAVVAAIAIPEIYSVFTFNEPGTEGDQWTMKSDRRPGDFDFDPLNLRPEDPAELDELQTKEINNGRLAMIGIAGMIAQELVDGQKIF